MRLDNVTQHAMSLDALVSFLLFFLFLFFASSKLLYLFLAIRVTHFVVMETV